MEPFDAPSFSDGKHARGEWDTSALAYRKGPLRAAAGYISAKRRGVTRLADAAGTPRLVLDAGAGSGAYAIWFLARTPCTVVSVDIARAGLKKIVPALQKSGVAGRAFPVCADIEALPFKNAAFDAAFSVDALGHVGNAAAALDELARTCRPGAPLFVHSECADYQSRWPDRALIARLGEDVPAARDGHIGLRASRELRELYGRRFRVVSFTSPAGLLGWLLGYPEKYREAFERAGWVCLSRVATAFAVVKKLPVLGPLLRFVNATTNHAEILLGLSGGGSSFAFLKRTDSTGRLP
jgi:SAM-dependent methyltransferase